MKIGSIEIGLGEIQPILAGLYVLANSRIGLAILILVAFGCFLVPKIDRISQDTSQMARSLDDTRQTVRGSNDMLIRLLEHCRVEPGKTETANAR